MTAPIRKKRPAGRGREVDTGAIRSLARKIEASRAVIAFEQDKVKTWQEELVGLMQTSGMKSTTVDAANGEHLSVTLVEGTSIVIDESLLKKKLGARMWDRVTSRVLDKRKLDANVAAGDIDPMVIAECSNEVPRTPFVKVARKK